MQKYTKQTNWLLQGDPAIRYQTLRDLVKAPVKDIEKEKQKILKEGWGLRFMDLQQQNGSWSNKLYSPKWTSTFYTLLLLKRFGAPNTANIEKACRLLLDKGFYEKDGGINYWKSWQYGECCVTGMLLSMLCHFKIKDERIERMAEFLINEQMPDKGWNCERPIGARHSSFHTTLSVLEGLWAYEQVYADSTQTKTIQQKQQEGMEFLLEHHLYKSNSTWKTVNPQMTKLSFPPRWRFDIIRCLDYLQEKNVKKDIRLQDALDLLKNKQTADGLWKLEHKYPAKVFFEMEKVGQPSRWNTLRAMRILKWAA